MYAYELFKIKFSNKLHRQFAVYSVKVLFLKITPDDHILFLHPQTRVAGGGEADVGEYPWAALLYINRNGQRFICGGTLVNDR